MNEKASDNKDFPGSGKVAVAALVALFALHWYESEQYPALYDFGKNDWSVRCEGQERSYRLVSSNPPDSQSTKSITRRSLDFHGEDGKRYYTTHKFDHESLDKDGVWRFTYNPKDVGLFVEKDQSKVLSGDEAVFEIAADFQSMAIQLKAGQRLALACRRIE